MQPAINDSQIANIKVDLGKILNLLDSYIKLARHDSTLTHEQIAKEELFRTMLNSVDRRVIKQLHHYISTRRCRKKKDERLYLLNLLLENSLESRLYFPRLWDPEILSLGETEIYERLEKYIFDAKNAAGQFTPTESFHYDFEMKLNKTIESKMQKGHKGDRLTEEVALTMLKDHYNELVAPMNQKSFRSMYRFFKSIDSATGDDLLTVMYESFKKRKQIDFELVKYYLWQQGFEHFLLTNKTREVI